MPLLNDKRLHALHNVSRWGGWVKRPYSVLEHTLLGAELLMAKGELSSVRPFLLHDMEESQFGDITTHNKRKFMNARYYATVNRWNAELCGEVGIHPSDLSGQYVKYVDHVMLHAEHIGVAMVGDPELFSDKPTTLDVRDRCVAIRDDKYTDVNHAIHCFWELFNASGQR